MSHISPLGRRPHSTRTAARRVLLADDSRPQPCITMAVGGTLLRVQNAKYSPPERAGGKRGKITGFSNDSRRRLMDLMASINRQAHSRPPLFITLTYPATWPDSPGTWKGHLDAFFKRLGRRWPDAAAVWRLEFQRRGAPHFHLILFNVAFISAGWVAACWADIVGSEDRRHYQAGTEVRRVRTWGGVMSYVAKYFSKPVAENVPGHVGRYWGVHNREALPIELVSIPTTHGHYFKFRRVLLQYCVARYRESQVGKVQRAVVPASGAVVHSGHKGRYRPSTRSEYQGFKVYCSYQVMLQLLRALEV